MGGSEENARTLKDLIMRYYRVSSQHINESKTTLMFNRDNDLFRSKALEDVLQITSTSEPGKYLDLPTVWERSKKEALGYLKGQIRDKISGWIVKVLNQASKEILIKSVITPIHSYVTSIFKLAKTQCSEISTIITDFW